VIKNFKYSQIDFEQNWLSHFSLQNGDNPFFPPQSTLDISFTSSGVDFHKKNTIDNVVNQYTDECEQVVQADKSVNVNNSFFQNFFSSLQSLSSSDLLPPAIKYLSPGVIVFERPPTYQLIQYIPYRMDQIEYDNNNDDCSDHHYTGNFHHYTGNEMLTYRIPVPWQLYIIDYDKKGYTCNSVRMYFMHSQLNDVSQTLFLPPLPNFFANGRLCRPMFDSYDEIDKYPKNISGIISAAHDWIWNTGFNHDLSEAVLNIGVQSMEELMPKDSLGASEWKKRAHNVSPTLVSRVMSLWETYSIDDIVNFNWPNPSLTSCFESDHGWYFENNQDRFTEYHTNNMEEFVELLPPRRMLTQTYSDVIVRAISGEDNEYCIPANSFSKDSLFISALEKLFQ